MKMYKLLLVDDEKYVMEGLEMKIDWHKYDIEIVGKAQNGLAAYEMIKTRKPDIIITDIYMPKMNGLELIEKTLDLLPHTKAIILSGYQDFKYAQTAIRNKAYDYILKPIKAEKIIKIIEKAKLQIEKELAEIRDEKKLKRQLRESLPVLREKYLKYVLTNKLELISFKKRYQYLDVNLGEKNFVVMAFAVEENKIKEKEKSQLVMIGIKNLIGEIINDSLQGEVLEELSSMIIAIINYNEISNEIEAIEYLQKIGQKIKNAVEKSYNLCLTIGIGRLYKESEYIGDSYKEALEALEYKMFLGKGEVIYYNDVTVSRDNFPMLYPFSKEEQIIKALKIGDVINLKGYIKDFLEFYFNKEQILPRYFKKACMQLTYIILRKLVEWDMELDIYRNSNNNIEIDIDNAESYKKLKEILTKFIINIAAEINKRNKCQNQYYVDKACKYIENNFNKQISLQDISNSVHLTKNYFANLFKSQTGNTVMEYLTEIRINKAQELIKETDLKIYEIAERVGYNNSNYFIKVFKKFLGTTPNNYRNI